MSCVTKFCIRCGEGFPFARYKIGYLTCTDCGEEDAQREAERRKRCIAPAYNKGAYQYVGNVDIAKDCGRK